MKSVLISIQPKWCELIAIGKKTIEVRKTAPKLQTPFKCYIYCTNEKHKGEVLLIGNDGKQVALGDYRNAFHWKNIGNGKVIGEFVCDRIGQIEYQEKYLAGLTSRTALQFFADKIKSSCLTLEELNAYGKCATLYGWHISDLKIYDTPKELGEFNYPCPKTESGCDDCLKHGPYGWDFDEKSKKIYCTRRLKCPPQSWCYVE